MVRVPPVIYMILDQFNTYFLSVFVNEDDLLDLPDIPSTIPSKSVYITFYNYLCF